jgi:hypothetical protein
MKFIWNWLSGQTYTETNDALIDEHGDVFNKCATGYVSQDGVFIERVNGQLLNTQTGEWSTTTDVFQNNVDRTF